LDSSSSFALELRGICKRYGRNHVLRNLTVSMGAGQFHVLVGRNGAGKSTLLRILGRREPADSGDGMLLGRPLSDDLAEHGHDVAFVSEATDYAVPGTMRAFFSRYLATNGAQLRSRCGSGGATGSQLSRRKPGT
jgi:ABC-type multidrug transport system ATPase subunit